MKCTLIIDSTREEEVMIYAHQKTSLVDDIEALVNKNSLDLIGYKDKTIIKLSQHDIFAFTVENNKIYAITKDERFQIKQRLYEMENILDDTFVKINQSCIVNIKKIDRFDASFGGSLMVTLKNNYRDYISRRQMKTVKERIGF